MTGKYQSRHPGLVPLLLAVTILFYLLLGGCVLLARRLPKLITERVEAALTAEEIDTARRWARKIRDEESQTEYLRLCDYREAGALMTGEHWAEAAELYAGLGSYEDAREQRRECTYRLAIELAAQGDWSAAAEAFEQLGGYADSAERLDECRYRHACALEENGAAQEAFSLFASLGSYADSAERMAGIAVKETGLSDATAAINAFRNRSPEEVERINALKQRRDELPKGILDVGFYHTVALREDGTVLACGDNSCGQCDVGGWCDVTSVAAGAYHTLALRRDGTVLACGRDSEEQCSVSGWRDIVAVAAADYASFGLKRDGTVVHTGYRMEYYSDADDWVRLTAITGGSTALGALRSDGTALITQPSAVSDDLTELTELAVNTGYAVGLREDGSVISPCFALPEWGNILTLSCSGTGVTGLRSDGTVCAYWFRTGTEIELSAVTDAVAIACGGTHFAWVRADGTVHVLGETDRGQGDTADWRLFGAPGEN